MAVACATRLLTNDKREVLKAFGRMGVGKRIPRDSLLKLAADADLGPREALSCLDLSLEAAQWALTNVPGMLRGAPLAHDALAAIERNVQLLNSHDI